MSTPPENAVESYLDAMFDRLAGTGAAGRRLLADAETHLLASAAAGRDRGLTDYEAERHAIARFGPVDAIVRRVPVPTGNLHRYARRVLTGGWGLAGAGLFWYGVTGLLTWLIGWPWAKLLVTSGRFASWPPCGSSAPTPECLNKVHASLDMVPAGGARFPYLFVAAFGAAVLTALFWLRRGTRLGTPAWTPSRAATTLCLAVPFTCVGTLLMFYGVTDIVDGHYMRISYMVAGTTALATAFTVLRLRARSTPNRRTGEHDAAQT
jgi:hypothetical protein